MAPLTPGMAFVLALFLTCFALLTYAAVVGDRELRAQATTAGPAVRRRDPLLETRA